MNGLEKIDRYQVGVIYTQDKVNRLKTFLRIINMTASEFTAEALDNEIDARLQAMDEDRRKAVERLLES